MVGNVDFSYFEETPMAARARLAGYGDAEHQFGVDVSPEEGGDSRDLIGEFEEEARRMARELDNELAELLDAEGDIATF